MVVRNKCQRRGCLNSLVHGLGTNPMGEVLPICRLGFWPTPLFSQGIFEQNWALAYQKFFLGHVPTYVGPYYKNNQGSVIIILGAMAIYVWEPNFFPQSEKEGYELWPKKYFAQQFFFLAQSWSLWRPKFPEKPSPLVYSVWATDDSPTLALRILQTGICGFKNHKKIVGV